MSETQPPAIRPASGELDAAKLVYILYFVSVAAGITAIAGVIVAYLKRGEATATAASHFTFQIRTFWIGLLFGVVSALTLIIGIGFLLGFATLIWFLVRAIKGFMLALDGKPIADPETWLW
ncbi:DUF4870 family protein [Parvibaculum sp.]|jgi:uncharacterized membrane protein|uniref:DUF4870 family protein n=1 Tax=Parvibaculum sp. TaxID=2024848 RepID=UPI002A2EE11C|nr:hypothetical protein [Parvibaculum sp.]